MDKKRLDRIVREEVAALLEARRSAFGGTTGYRGFAGGRSRDDIEGIDPTTGFQKPWSTRGDYPVGGSDEPDDRTPEERRADRDRARAAQDAERTARSAAYQASQPKQKHVMTRGEGPARRVTVKRDGSITFPDMTRYDFLTNPANSDVYALRDEVLMPGYSAVGAIAGYATVEYDAASGTWTVTGQIKDASKSHYGPTLGAGRTTVGTGSDVESAYRDMLSQSDLGYMLGGSPLSESRWAKIAGLMTEGRKSTGEKKLFASPPSDLEADEKALAREIGLEVKGDSVVGTMKQQRAFYERLAQKAKKTGPASVPPFDKDAYEPVGGPEEVDEGSGAAPGATRKIPPVDTKKGPPSKEDLDAIKKLGPFERKKR